MAAKEHKSVFQRKVRSHSFGLWVRVNRQRLNLSQKEAAELASIGQQHWSKMERYGLIPRQELIETICRAVNCPLSEGLDQLKQETNVDFDSYASVYNARYQSFKQRLIGRGQDGSTVGVFVVRDSPVAADTVAVQEYLNVLIGASNIWITLLFRRIDPNAWRSFHRLMGTLVQQSQVNDPAMICRRIRAFYRRQEYADDLPLTHPYILISDNHGLELASAVFDPAVEATAIKAGFSGLEATKHSLHIVGHEPHQAARVADWIGLSNTIDPLSSMWVPIADTNTLDVT